MKQEMPTLSKRLVLLPVPHEVRVVQYHIILLYIILCFTSVILSLSVDCDFGSFAYNLYLFDIILLATGHL
jgi:hypothetical protein